LPGRNLKHLSGGLLQVRGIDPPYSMEDMALDVVALMDELDIETAHIIGISMGDFIAQLLAAKYPTTILSMASIMSGRRCLDLPPTRQIPPGTIRTGRTSVSINCW
jgi:pimeloyl-ACP methyl ester carboxylesterase